MSYTELYRVDKSGDVKPYAEFGNSHHGGMFIWTAFAIHWLGMKMFPLFDELQKQQRVWDLWKDSRLSRGEKLILFSTFDGQIIPREMLDELAGAMVAFELRFADANHGSHLGRQAMRLRELARDEDCFGAAWNQTSVNADPWPYEDEEGTQDSDARCYNINTGSEHWKHSILEEGDLK